MRWDLRSRDPHTVDSNQSSRFWPVLGIQHQALSMALRSGVDLGQEEARLALALDPKARKEHVAQVTAATSHHDGGAAPTPAGGAGHLRTKEEEEALVKADHERVKQALHAKMYGDDAEERKRQEEQRKAEQAKKLAAKLAAAGLAPK